MHAASLGRSSQRQSKGPRNEGNPEGLSYRTGAYFLVEAGFCSPRDRIRRLRHILSATFSACSVNSAAKHLFTNGRVHWGCQSTLPDIVGTGGSLHNNCHPARKQGQARGGRATIRSAELRQNSRFRAGARRDSSAMNNNAVVNFPDADPAPPVAKWSAVFRFPLFWCALSRPSCCQ